MGDLIRLDDHRHSWKEVFRHVGEHSSLHVYVDPISGEIEVFQLNSENEGVRTCLPATESTGLSEALSSVTRKFVKG